MTQTLKFSLTNLTKALRTHLALTLGLTCVNTVRYGLNDFPPSRPRTCSLDLVTLVITDQAPCTSRRELVLLRFEVHPEQRDLLLPQREHVPAVPRGRLVRRRLRGRGVLRLLCDALPPFLRL